jgi:large subunit ribosomal protein L21
MYAIVEIAGNQYKVEKDRFVYTQKLSAEAGETVEFDSVLLVESAGQVQVGAPTVSGAKVKGTVLDHVKSDKVLVFKKKRRKGYKKSHGHRQQYTKVMIDEIVA